MTPGHKNFAIGSVFALLSGISFFQIGSYWADKNNFNGFFGWVGIGLALAGVAIYFLYKSWKGSIGNDTQ